MTGVRLLLAIALGACGPSRTYLVATAPDRLPEADRLGSVPAFVIVPALDHRPPAEREGRGAEVSFLFASMGASMSHASGASVLDGDELLRWRNPAAAGGADPSASSAAFDIGRALGSAAGRPVKYIAGTAETAAARAGDGAVIVTVVVDHATQVKPANADFSQTTNQQGNYQVTTTSTSNETFGPFWTFAVQIELGQVRGPRIVRRLVRRAASSSSSPTAYAEVIRKAATEIVHAVASEWARTNQQ